MEQISSAKAKEGRLLEALIPIRVPTLVEGRPWEMNVVNGIGRHFCHLPPLPQLQFEHALSNLTARQATFD
jgi:hypothetical protein